MGYSTSFDGEFKFDKPLSFEHMGIIEGIHDDADPAIAELGLVRPTYLNRGKRQVIERGYMQWEMKDRETLKWDQGEKFYFFVEWLTWLCDTLFEPWGYKLNGTVTFTGEDAEPEASGIIVVTNNVVTATTLKELAERNVEEVSILKAIISSLVSERINKNGPIYIPFVGLSAAAPIAISKKTDAAGDLYVLDLA